MAIQDSQSQLGLEQVWAWPEFTIQQYLEHHGYKSQGWVADRLLVTLILEDNGVIRPCLQHMVNHQNFVDNYRLVTAQLTKRATILKTRF